ncbi:protein rrnad1-like [Plakobranchus ocellatus]|uniref:Protein rrnad1-like n=1 Tax=Plakobranchus ocellatus TaxID=259542 RepID=A0AAV4B4X8_9GAST|nr:protein rrnad1-like [Plakobranchus ocellatus]
MASLTICDYCSEVFIQERVRKIISVISFYDWIINSYVSDFYSKEFWRRLPSSLQSYFDLVEPPDLAWLLCSFNGQLQSCCIHPSILPPLSLLALRQCINSLALQRRAVDTEALPFREFILQALGREIRKPDDHQKDSENSFSEVNQEVQISAQQEKVILAAPGSLPNYKNGQCMDMQHIFRKHVKPKKQHEINKLGKVINLVCQAAESSAVVDVGAGLGHLARVINLVCQAAESSAVVDVGAGLGHLARLLAFQHDLRVTTIEAAGSHAPKASEYDQDMQKSIYKAKLKKRQPEALDAFQNHHRNSSAITHADLKESEQQQSSHLFGPASVSHCSIKDIGNGPSDSPRQAASKAEFREKYDAELPSHVICTVQPDIAATQFLDILKRHSDDKGENSASTFVLVSLHACGDLTPTLLRVFLNCPNAQGLASVACCYMKMSASTRCHSSAIDNFPMSKYVQHLPFLSLSYEAREMACHFADAYHQRLLENPVHLKSHSYRATLQHLVTKVDPNFKSGQTRLISKIKIGMTFEEYAAENLTKLGISLDSVPKDVLSDCTKLTNHWKRVVGFYTLRLSLAPLVETLLLLDRALFLLDNGVRSLLVPIFDPQLSPRNFALLALKQ